MKRILTFIALLSLVVIFQSGCNEKETLPDAYGNFEAEEVIVSAETAGTILDLMAEEGSQVAQGQVIAILDSTSLVIKKQQIIAQRAAVAAELEGVRAQAEVYFQQKANFQKDLARVEALLAEGAATQKQLDDIEGGILMAEKQAEAIQARRLTILRKLESIDVQMEEAAYFLSKTRIRSPVSATVLRCFAEAGELTSPGRALCKLADLRQMSLRVYVSAAQLAGLKLGQEVEVGIDAAGGGLRRYPAHIIHIAEQAEFTPKIIQTREERINMVYAIEISVKNDGFLKIGMPGEVYFHQEDQSLTNTEKQ